MNGFKVLIASAILSCLNAPHAMALEKTQALWLQQALKDHGYDIGKPDGIIGPKSKEKIAEFAVDYDAPTELNLLFSWMIGESVKNSEDIEDESILQEIQSKVAEQLKDPESAQIRKVRLHHGPSGAFVCGEVNGKNDYGAYAGYSPFFSLGAYTGNFAMFYVDTEPYGVAFYKCLTAFPKR